MSDGPAITTFDRDVSAAAVMAELESNGCAIVAELADDVCMQRLYAELQPYLDEAPFGQTEFVGRTSRRRNGLLAKSDAYATCHNGYHANDVLAFKLLSVYKIISYSHHQHIHSP